VGGAVLSIFRFWLLAAVIAALPAALYAWSDSNPADGRYLATAYDETGITASGLYTHRHIVAADPDVLPIGTIIRISHAGSYSGEYVVGDTGRKIVGRRLDIYIPSLAACKEFGVRHVFVRVVSVGGNTHRSAQAAYTEVKQDVEQELENDAPGGAATAEDWAATTVAKDSGAPN
jgi:3D (Asp-Asp-Asp) domain-containing protein